MNDLVVITAHCPTLEQEKLLEKCVDSVLNFGFHVAVISHTHVPIHIQKKCNYYFYDHHNDVNYDEALLYYSWYSIDEKTTIVSKYFTKEFYGFAIYRMFTIASQIGKNFGYKNLHHIEYDCLLQDKGIIEEHNELLKEYDSVFYTNNGKENGFIMGAFKSFRIEKLPELFQNYNKEKIRDMMVNIPLKPLESFTKHIFMKSGKVFFGKQGELLKTGKIVGNESKSRLKHFTPYYDSRDNKFYFFYKNNNSETDSIRIFINGNNLIKFHSEPNHWNTRPLCNFDDLESLLVVMNDKIVYDKTFTSERRELLRENSYIKIDEKDN